MWQNNTLGALYYFPLIIVKFFSFIVLCYKLLGAVNYFSIDNQCHFSIYSPYVVKYYGSYFKNTDLWVKYFLVGVSGMFILDLLNLKLEFLVIVCILYIIMTKLGVSKKF